MDSKDLNSKYFGSFHWFVIQTKPRDEHRVKTHLFNQKIEAFLPLVETHQYCNGKMVRRIKPLFPNYIFTRLDLKVHYYKVKWTRGVNRILGIRNGREPVSEIVIQMLKNQMGDDDTVKLLEDFQEGDLVQITSGPFKEFVGIFQRRLSSDERVRILLNLIGTEVPVQISRWELKKVA
jgi:transcriptional antiterminator RfaH